MANLIVLGNGFDLNFQLPTKYTPNLKEILRENDEVFFEKINKLYFNDDPNLWSDFEGEIGDVKGMEFLHDALSEKLQELYSQDIQEYPPEHELYGAHWPAIENALHAAASSRPDFMNVFIEEHDDLINGTYDFIEAGFQEMARKSDSILDEKIRGGNLDNDIEFSKDDYYITFNYTSTLEKLYPTIPSVNINHIHGFRNSDLIFGNLEEKLYVGASDFREENPYYSPDDGDNREEFNYKDYIDTVTYRDEEYDSYNRGVEELIEQLNDTMMKSLQLEKLQSFLESKDIDKIFVFGLSLGDVDLAYFEEIGSIFPNAEWIISYHSNPDNPEWIDPVRKNVSKLTFCNNTKVKLVDSTIFRKLLNEENTSQNQIG